MLGQASIWNDDEIEIFIVPCKQKSLLQFIINSNGDFLINKNKKIHQMDFQVKASVKSKNYWEVEMAIPLKELGINANPANNQLKINICRLRPPSLKIMQELSTWSHLKNNFFEVENFGTLTFK